IVQQVSPGLAFRLGNHWTLDYTPTFTTYSNDDFKDTLDHSVKLMFGTSYQDWVLNFFTSYVSSSQPQVETATQTDQETFLTSLAATYHFNSKMALDLGVKQNI